MAKSQFTRICKFCKNEFTPWTGNAGFYCSSICYHAGFSIERFWANVTKTETCWLWTGPTDKDGYGKSGKERAHRKSWRMAYGPLNSEEQVLHHCDNPPCVRPVHLFKGSDAENKADMVAKGRSPWGSRHPNAILTEEAVRRARVLFVPRKFGYRKIADLLGCPEPAIRAAISGVTWTHLE